MGRPGVRVGHVPTRRPGLRGDLRVDVGRRRRARHLRPEVGPRVPAADGPRRPCTGAPGRGHDVSDLAFVLRFPALCTEGVTRRDEFQPCDKPAVAVRLDPESGEPYPVCARHARADMVLLPDLIAAVRAQVAAEIDSYTDAVLDLVDTQNGARL